MTHDSPSTNLIVGYARVSTQDQNLTLQRNELVAAGCTHVYAEKISAGRPLFRPELERMLNSLRHNDVVVVSRLDRLARHTSDLLKIADRIGAAGAALRSLAEPWADTTTPAGKMVMTVFAGIAEFERSVIVERTGRGRVAARKRGVEFGPKRRITSHQVETARGLLDKGYTADQAGEAVGISRTSVYRLVINQ